MNNPDSAEAFICSRSVKLTPELDEWMKIQRVKQKKTIAELYFEAVQNYKDLIELEEKETNGQPS